jgi:hypothetical protein
MVNAMPLRGSYRCITGNWVAMLFTLGGLKRALGPLNKKQRKTLKKGGRRAPDQQRKAVLPVLA